MSNTPSYQSFANRLIKALANKGIAASHSKGNHVKTLSEITGTSEQICRRYLRGDVLPTHQKIQQLAQYLAVSPGWLLFGDDENASGRIDTGLLHYILKKSHYLYPVSKPINTDYADFVLQLLDEASNVAVGQESLYKIVDVAIASVAAYGEMRQTEMDEDKIG